MKSDHAVNRAQIEAIKGVRYANLEDSLASVRAREQKYAMRMAEYCEMEAARKYEYNLTDSQ
jgi:hypothetical protein